MKTELEPLAEVVMFTLALTDAEYEAIPSRLMPVLYRLLCQRANLLNAAQVIAGVNGSITVDSEWVTMPNGAQINLGQLIGETLTP